MTRVLVTGGCGFIGSNLVPMLLEKGHQVRVLDNLSVGRRENLSGGDVDLVVADIRDREAVAKAMKGIKIVVHLAAHTNVVDSVQDPWQDFEVNVEGTLNLLRASVANFVTKFVFASSNAPLGEQEPPVSEDQVPRPLSPYGASKLAGEGYCSAFHGSYGLETVSLRFANVYGPRSTHKTSVVAKFIKDALNGGPLTIYGDGQQTRDFIYVDDLCRAILLAMTKEVGGEVLQIGTGVETKIIDLAEMVRQMVSCDGLEIVFAPPKRGEIRHNYSSIIMAERVLGFRPEVALGEGLRKTSERFIRFCDNE